MTCIVGLVEDGKIYLAGDSLTVSVPDQYHSRVSQTIKRETKVFQKGGMLFGGNGSVRMIQLLRYELVLPEYQPGRDKVEYLSTDFVKAMKAVTEEDFGREHGLEGGLLIGWEGQLYTIGREWGVCDTGDAYDAIGKASEVAIGSLHSTGELGISPLHRLRLALLATQHHTCVVSEPFYMIADHMDQAEILPF